MAALSAPLDAILAPLRPHIQPLTAQLPPPIRSALSSLVGEKCYNTLIVQLVPEPDCLSYALSKTLGVGIITLSAVVKVPQLVKIVNARSGAGLSLVSLALETASYVVTAAYNFRSGNPLTTYGEAALIAGQNAAIGAAMLAYGSGDTARNGNTAGAATWVAGVAVLAGIMAREEMGLSFGMVTQAMTLAQVAGVASKVPQIWTNYRQAGTGQLSAFAVFAFLFGSGSRIFTTIQEVDDPIILTGFVSAFVLNLVLALQMLYYWNASPATKAKVRAKGRTAKAVLAGDEKVSALADSTGAQKVKSPSTRRRG